MGLWQIDTDTLARSRFVLSPFAETFASLKLLHSGTGAHPGEEAWLRAHLPGCGRPGPGRHGPTSACRSGARSPPPWRGTTCPDGRPRSWPTSGSRP
ncbi:hypothetical protein FB563_7122, partial [Streptomyces puniciscabiei]